VIRSHTSIEKRQNHDKNKNTQIKKIDKYHTPKIEKELDESQRKTA